MPAPSEHKTVQARILHYAQEIGWTLVPSAEAEQRPEFRAEGSPPLTWRTALRCFSTTR